MLKRIMVLVAVLLVAAFGTWLFVQDFLNKPMTLPDTGFTLDVPVGMTLPALGARLAAAGVLDYPAALTAYARLVGQANAIKAGNTTSPPGRLRGGSCSNWSKAASSCMP